jgi:hypothetical protein
MKALYRHPIEAPFRLYTGPVEAVYRNPFKALFRLYTGTLLRLY